MSEGVRWGVLSTANIGRVAVNPAIQASKNGTLVAVASRGEEKARTFAHEHGIPQSFGRYEDLLAEPAIDAVYVPLPNGLHAPWVIRALEAGKHVLCEKPLALDEAECARMQAAAEANGLRLMEAFMYRFHPRTAQVVEWARNQRIGPVRVVRSSFTFRLRSRDNIRLDPELGGGALMDVGCYCVNVSRTVVGEEPVSAQAVAHWTDRGVDESLCGILRFPGGAVAHFDCALDMERCEYLEVGGTDGYLSVPAAFLPGTGDVRFDEVRGRDPVIAHAVEGVDQYRVMVEHFARCVLDGSDPTWPVADARANMRTIDALYRSARAGGVPVEV